MKINIINSTIKIIACSAQENSSSKKIAHTFTNRYYLTHFKYYILTHTYFHKVSFRYYVITEEEGGGLQMIPQHVIVTNTTTVKVITEGEGVKIGQKLIT